MTPLQQELLKEALRNLIDSRKADLDRTRNKHHGLIAPERAEQLRHEITEAEQMLAALAAER